MYYVYLLENQNDKSPQSHEGRGPFRGWYIGLTSDLQQRIREHLSGKGGRTTKLKKDWKLIYFEGYLNKKDAAGRERFLKSGSGRRFLKKQLNHYLP